MKVLVLSPNADLLVSAITAAGDQAITPSHTITPEEWPEVDYVVSFGYRHVIKREKLWEYAGRIINIHISILPYNRGASPNFWSWFDDTPKGVTIHLIIEGIDTGPILYQQRPPYFRNIDTATLATTYSDLITLAAGLFRREWDSLRCFDVEAAPQSGLPMVGSFHKSGEELPFLRLLGNKGYDTPVRDILQLGRIYRAAND